MLLPEKYDFRNKIFVLVDADAIFVNSTVCDIYTLVIL